MKEAVSFLVNLNSLLPSSESQGQLVVARLSPSRCGQQSAKKSWIESEESLGRGTTVPVPKSAVNSGS